MLFAKFCDKILSGCCTTRATSHILGRPVLGQTIAGIRACIAINKKDDDRRAILKNAKRALSEVMRSNEETAACRKRKQAVMDELLTPYTKKSAKISWTCTEKTVCKELDAKIASYFYENGLLSLPFNLNTTALSNFALMIEERSSPVKILFKVTKYLTASNFLGNSLTKRMSPLRNLLLLFSLFRKNMEQL